MKYLYILTSSEKDLYYEQFFLSISSLRLHNPNAFIVALIDSKTKAGLTGKRSGYEQVVSQVVTVVAPEELSQKEVSRWLKSSMKKYVTGDFLYIDCDTIIAASLDGDFSPEIKIGAVLDTHVGLDDHFLAPHFMREDLALGFSSFNTGLRYNSGVMFCRDLSEVDELFNRWHELWLFSKKKGSTQDMPALNQASEELGGAITEIGGEWNCHIAHNGLPFLADAKIIHYFATVFDFIDCPFILGSRKTFLSVKEAGEISPEIMALLKNPKAAFESHSRIIADKAELDVINSKIFLLLLMLRKKSPRFFKAINSLLIRLRHNRIIKKIYRRPVAREIVIRREKS